MRRQSVLAGNHSVALASQKHVARTRRPSEVIAKEAVVDDPVIVGVNPDSCPSRRAEFVTLKEIVV
jgi:hypothetical protein